MKLTKSEIGTLIKALDDAWNWHENRIKFIGEDHEDYTDLVEFQQNCEELETKLTTFLKESKPEQLNLDTQSPDGEFDM